MRIDKQYIHKDKSPLETISIIRNILHEIGITVYEYNWTNINDTYYSVRINDKNGFGTNGKGITRELALASAYGEFIERVQNNVLYPSHFGLMHETNIKLQDAVIIKGEDLIHSNKNIISYLFPTKQEELKTFTSISCVPYYNVFENKTELLPEGIIKSFCGSNGMAAGNSPEEAILQGISEIFERYVIEQLSIIDKIDLPIIPIDLIRDNFLKYSIEKLESIGYKVIIKDCTLNNMLPVVGVIIMNKDRSKGCMNFGVDPIFEIAVQRCLTELFQGASLEIWEKYKMQKINYDLTLSYRKIERGLPVIKDYNNYRISNIINKCLLTNKETRIPSVFQDSFINNKSSLLYFIEIINKTNHSLYIRDVSYLGFPSYHIYIPGLSEMYTEDVFFNKRILVNKISKVVLNLKESSIRDTEECIDAIENILFSIQHLKLSYSLQPDNSFVSDFANIIMEKNNDLYDFHFEFLLSCLCIKIGNYKKAGEYLESHLNNLEYYGIHLLNKEYYECVLLFLKLKSLNFSNQNILFSLINIFGKSLSNEVMLDLKNTLQIFQYYNLPSCGNCNLCEIKNICHYDEWKRFVSLINSKIDNNIIDQTHVGHIFFDKRI